jgi:ketosteroid isomerase-like protein
MSQENVEVVIGQFEGVNARDFEAVMDAYADDVVLALHGKLRGLGGEGAVGKKAVGEWFGEWFRTFGRDYRFEIEESRDWGDRVFVVATHRGQGRASGVPVTQRTAYVYTVREGKVRRVEVWRDREEALEAVKRLYGRV